MADKKPVVFDLCGKCAPFLSLSGGIPIAVVRGGEADGTIIYISDDSVHPPIKSRKTRGGSALADRKTIGGRRVTAKMRRGLTQIDKKIMEAADERDGGQLEGEDLDELLAELEEDLEELGIDAEAVDVSKLALGAATEPRHRSFEIEEGRIQLLPCSKSAIIKACDGDGKNDSVNFSVDRLYIAAPQGAGKSHYIGDWLAEYRAIYPKRKIFVYSDIKHDPKIDNVKGGVTRIPIELLYEAGPPEDELIAQSVVIFDDIDSIMDKKIQTC